MIGFFLALAWFINFEVKESKKEEGVWRIILLLPMSFAVGITIWVLFEVSNNTGSHNLLPFELIAYLVYAAIAHFILVLIKGIFTKEGANK